MRQEDKEASDSEFKFYIFLHNLYLPTVQEAENLHGPDELESLLQFGCYSLGFDQLHNKKKKLPHEVSLCSGSQPGTDGKYCSRLLV